MTSPPRPLASAEHSSELRESAQLQAQQPAEENKPEYVPPAVSSAVTTSLSSISSPLQTSLAYGSSHLSVNVTPTTSSFPAPGARQELPSRSAKRTASSTELRSPKSRRDSQGSHQLSNTPTTSTGAQFTPAPHHQAPDRATGRARAPASVGPQSPTYTRESQAGKRGRARKNPLHPADSRSSAGPRVDDDGDVPMSMLSPRSHTSRLLDLPPLPFHSTSRVPTPSEGLSAGPSSSSGYRRKVGASFPNSPGLVALSPSLSTGEFHNPPFSVASRSAFPRPPLTPSHPSTIHTPLSAGKCFTSPRSPSLPYGSPSIPTSPPPYHNLPTLNSVFKQAPVQPSVEADGFIIIRNAISLPLIRDIVAMIAKGLQVVSMSETIQTYALPLQAYQVRDEFVTVCSLTITPINVLTVRSIAEMAPCPPAFLRPNGQEHSKNAVPDSALRLQSKRPHERQSVAS